MALSPNRVFRLAEWPDLDQWLWRTGLLPGDILEGGAYAEGLRPTTVRNSARGYGRWLAVLAHLDSSALLGVPVAAEPKLQFNPRRGWRWQGRAAA